jgi:hypothetical protein
VQGERHIHDIIRIRSLSFLSWYPCLVDLAHNQEHHMTRTQIAMGAILRGSLFLGAMVTGIAPSHSAELPAGGDRDIMIFVERPADPTGPRHPLQDILGRYESIGIESHRETSGIWYQYLEINGDEGYFTYSDNIIHGSVVNCSFYTAEIQSHGYFYLIDMPSCVREGYSGQGHYSLLVAPDSSFPPRGVFPARADATVTLFFHIDGSVIEMASHRMIRMTKEPLLKALQRVTSNDANMGKN